METRPQARQGVFRVLRGDDISDSFNARALDESGSLLLEL
jgi:hypothetical protein